MRTETLQKLLEIFCWEILWTAFRGFAKKNPLKYIRIKREYIPRNFKINCWRNSWNNAKKILRNIQLKCSKELWWDFESKLLKQFLKKFIENYFLRIYRMSSSMNIGGIIHEIFRGKSGAKNTKEFLKTLQDKLLKIMMEEILQ